MIFLLFISKKINRWIDFNFKSSLSEHIQFLKSENNLLLIQLEEIKKSENREYEKVEKYIKKIIYNSTSIPTFGIYKYRNITNPDNETEDEKKRRLKKSSKQNISNIWFYMDDFVPLSFNYFNENDDFIEDYLSKNIKNYYRYR